MSCPAETPPPPPRGYRLMQVMMGPVLGAFGLSCREFAELSSLRMDRSLTVSEALRFRFHSMMCGVCRRLPAQFEAMRSFLHRCEAEGMVEDVDGESGKYGEAPAKAANDLRLDAAARDRILERLDAVEHPGEEER